MSSLLIQCLFRAARVTTLLITIILTPRRLVGCKPYLIYLVRLYLLLHVLGKVGIVAYDRTLKPPTTKLTTSVTYGAVAEN